jgi:beta-lactamase superfamily II metal-dependent hydrolase
MRRPLLAVLTLALGLALPHPVRAAEGGKGLEIYVIDVEGGQATLLVSPTKGSLLIDTGWPGFEGRDAKRIVAAARDAGLTKIDFVLVTHHHRDHVGGVPQLAAAFPIGTFVDHGPNLEDSDVTREDYAAYQKAIEGHAHVVLKPGDTLPVAGLSVEAVAGAGERIKAPLKGAGEANPYCATEPAAPADPTENSRSLGVLVTYGSFRFLDLGDLTKAREIELACPANLLGHVDLYLATHHGTDGSNAKAIVWALKPRVAIIDNGPKKGASPAAWEIIHSSPGLEDLWQLHYAVEADAAHNVAADHIANAKEDCQGKSLKVSAALDGSFVVLNTGNGLQKAYPRK